MSRYEVLANVLDAEFTKPYTYGEADCFFLGCQIADAFDPSRKMVTNYKGAYRTLAGAQRALRKRGFKSLTQFFASHLKEVAPASAQAGDVVVIVIAGGEHVGICLGVSGRFVTKTDAGRSYHALSECVAAFRT